MPLDKDAASRFITAAIANQPSKPNSNSSFYSAEATVSDPLAGPGPHTRLSSLARISSDTSEKESEGAEAGSSSSSGEDLQVYASMVPNTNTASAGPSDITGSTGMPSGNRDSRETNQAQADKQKRKQEKKRKRLLGDGLPAAKKVQDPFSGRQIQLSISQAKC